MTEDVVLLAVVVVVLPVVVVLDAVVVLLLTEVVVELTYRLFQPMVSLEKRLRKWNVTRSPMLVKI